MILELIFHLNKIRLSGLHNSTRLCLQKSWMCTTKGKDTQLETSIKFSFTFTDPIYVLVIQWRDSRLNLFAFSTAEEILSDHSKWGHFLFFSPFPQLLRINHLHAPSSRCSNRALTSTSLPVSFQGGNAPHLHPGL